MLLWASRQASRRPETPGDFRCTHIHVHVGFSINLNYSVTNGCQGTKNVDLQSYQKWLPIDTTKKIVNNQCYYEVVGLDEELVYNVFVQY